MTTPTAHEKPTLADFAGTIVLVGAGKMGSAMLDGWLALGLSPASVVVIEPQPTPEVTALTSRGLKVNPPPTDVRDAAADRGRRVRHGTHQRGALRQGAFEKAKRASSHDRERNRVGREQGRERRHHRRRNLWLDRNHDRGNVAYIFQ